jgi:hypothetical protein
MYYAIEKIGTNMILEIPGHSMLKIYYYLYFNKLTLNFCVNIRLLIFFYFKTHLSDLC